MFYPTLPPSKYQRFGGKWTKKKLEVLGKYLNAYTQALKNQSFQLLYIDAFAGYGRTYLKNIASRKESSFFEDSVGQEELAFIDGSARIALKVSRPFSSYYFIELDSQKCESLESLKAEFPTLSDRINIIQGDANQAVKKLCRSMSWRDQRAVLFLDPLGAQVEWNTVEDIAKTGAIDLWWLFPLGAINRLLCRSKQKIPGTWKDRITRVFGTDKWEEKFYSSKKIIQKDLWNRPEESKLKKNADFKILIDFTMKRLKEIFPAILENPPILTNSKGSPLFLLCFAVGNPSAKAQKVALRIARSNIKGI